jgi:excisionase family DNA binding protein
VKYQMAKGMEQPGGGGAAGMASELAVGFSIAQQLMQQTGVAGAAPAGPAGLAGKAPAGQAGQPGPAGQAGLAGQAGPELLSPADVAKIIGVPETDVMTIIESGELGAKKIGASYRVTRAALDKYLSS